MPHEFAGTELLQALRDIPVLEIVYGSPYSTTEGGVAMDGIVHAAVHPADSGKSARK
jgi:hypothetical protein